MGLNYFSTNWCIFLMVSFPAHWTPGISDCVASCSLYDSLYFYHGGKSSISVIIYVVNTGPDFYFVD